MQWALGKVTVPHPPEGNKYQEDNVHYPLTERRAGTVKRGVELYYFHNYLHRTLLFSPLTAGRKDL